MWPQSLITEPKKMEIFLEKLHLVFWYNRRIQTTFRYLSKTWNLLFCTVYSLEKESRDSVCTLVCYKESKFTHLISVVSPKFFAIMFRGKQFDVGEKTTIMTLFTEGVAPMPNTNQNCVLISPKVVHRRFQVPPPKSNEKPVFCIS